MQHTEQLGYLIHHLAFVLDRQSDQVLQERLGIGFSQFKILMVLKQHEGVSQRHIAESLGQTEASISRQIRQMQERGLIVSKVKPGNRRQRVTLLADKGLRMVEEASAALNSYHRPIFESFDAREQEQLSSLLRSMHREACSGSKPGRCYDHFID